MSTALSLAILNMPSHIPIPYLPTPYFHIHQLRTPIFINSVLPYSPSPFSHIHQLGTLHYLSDTHQRLPVHWQQQGQVWRRETLSSGSWWRRCGCSWWQCNCQSAGAVCAEHFQEELQTLPPPERLQWQRWWLGQCLVSGPHGHDGAVLVIRRVSVDYFYID